MCGIAGRLDWSGEDVQPLEAQLEVLEHRGPDARGWYRFDRGAIGQNRLAIIDLETGDPPITNESGSVGVTLNGEIYNFGQLRDRLIRDGHELRTRGDTEVIAHLAERCSAVELAQALDGMFAFAVWDGKRQALILGRDRLGKKPLYYWAQNGRLVFASEIKGVLVDPRVPRRLNQRAVPAHLALGYVPTPETFYEGVFSLPPAHVLVSTADGEVKLERYWEPPLRGVSTHRTQVSLQDAADEVRRRLRGAVERRMIADRPLGAFLSGGIDSSAIVGLMCEVSTRPVRTFTIGFEDQDGFDERPFASVIAERFRTEHVEFVVRPDAAELIERLVWHYDQPFGDSSAIPTFLLSELTAQHVTVALSGDGGDELFAGYERFAAGKVASWYGSLPAGVRSAAGAAIPAVLASARSPMTESARRFLGAAGHGLPDAYLAWVSYVPSALRLSSFGAEGDWAIEHHRATWEGSASADAVDRMLDLNLRTYLLEDLLPKVDRMSMAHGLEVRSPLLDTALLEYAFGLDPELKLRGLRLKRVLKRAVDDLLPTELLRRRKRGFGVPLARWFRSDLATFVDARLAAPDARVRQHVSPELVMQLVDEHRHGARDRSLPLWALLTLEVFLRREGW